MTPSTEAWLISTISKRLERIAEGKEPMAEDRALTLLSILKDVAGDIPSLTDLPQHVKEWLEAAINARLDAIAEKREIAAEDRIATLTEALAALNPEESPNPVWGDVEGTLSNQTDLQSALDAKANDNAVVKTSGNQSNLSGDKEWTGEHTFYGNGPSFLGAATNISGTNPALQLRTEAANRRRRIQYRATEAADGPLNIDAWTGSGWNTVLSMSPAGHLLPGTNGSQDLGGAGARWQQVYAVDGAINTSDARDKTEPRQLNEAELAAALELAQLPSIWQWHHAIQSKGEAARLHCSPTVQDVISVMEKHELDPFRYAFICYDEWEQEPEAVDERTGEIYPGREAGNKYSLRHNELAMFIMHGIAAKLGRVELGEDDGTDGEN